MPRLKVKKDDPVPTDTVIATASYWRVEVKGIFDYAGEHFEPRVTYYVPEELYEGKLANGTAFKDMCASARVEHRT